MRNPIVTEHLVLQPIEDETIQRILARDLTGIDAGEGWPHPETQDGLRMIQEHGGMAWLVTRDGRVIGDCGTIGPPDANGFVEVGFGLAIPAMGQGYGAEVIAGLQQWLLTQPGVRQVIGDFMERLPEPSRTLTDPKQLLAEFLDYYRAAALRKLDGMSEEELRSSRLPSGWTPLGLLQHLTYVERRWLRWGFHGEQLADPWGPKGKHSDWTITPDDSVAAIITAFREECDRSRAIIVDADLQDDSSDRGRFQGQSDRPRLIWILFHLLQEYARHIGHLDIVRELADGSLGE